jgi:hypothetical protein
MSFLGDIIQFLIQKDRTTYIEKDGQTVFFEEPDSKYFFTVIKKSLYGNH